MKELNKHRLTIIPKYGDYYYPDSKTFEDDKGKIVYYGQQNDFPSSIIELYNKSSINATCVNAIRDGIVGGGLTTENEELLNRANRDGESWNDVLIRANNFIDLLQQDAKLGFKCI